MNYRYTKTALGLLGAMTVGLLPATAQTTTSFNQEGGFFHVADSWTNGLPDASTAGFVENRTAVIGTAAALNTGAVVTVSGNSSLERNGIGRSDFSGTLNINDTANVKISTWHPQTGAVLNWNSSGTFSLADDGPNASQARLLVNTARDVTINVNAGFWDMRGNGNPASVHFNHGTFNMNGGLLIADRMFRIGSGETSATLNYAADAEIRAASFGTFNDSVFDFEPGATLYLETGLLGSFGTQGFEWFRDEMRKGADSSVHIAGVHQSLGPEEGLDVSNFLTDTVELDGIWYNSITAIPEPRTYAFVFGLLGLAIIALRRRKRLRA
ncbi:MAG: hypothetical protein JJU00_17100 [Opitutales bacterium]|nr:hypothetical protein [Opitutales bacterium]